MFKSLVCEYPGTLYRLIFVWDNFYKDGGTLYRFPSDIDSSKSAEKSTQTIQAIQNHYLCGFKKLTKGYSR